MRKVLKWGAIALSAFLLLVIGAAIGRGGSDDSNSDARAAKVASEDRGDRAAENSTRDDDGDGVLNTYDPEPDDPDVSSYEELEEEPTPEPTPTPDPTDCDNLGINPQELKEGNCVSEGTKIQVVNKGTPLKLQEVRVKLDSIAHTTTIPRPYDSPLVGSYVVARVSVTNRLSAPVTVDAPSMFSLWLDDRSYNPDFDAMNESGEDGLVYEEIQPDETATGIVVFRVKPKRANALNSNGNLNVVQFSDAEGFGGTPTKRVGIIRTYN